MLGLGRAVAALAFAVSAVLGVALVLALVALAVVGLLLLLVTAPIWLALIWWVER